jgi:hypothetical protein
VTVGSGKFDSAFDMLLTFHFGETKVLIGRSGIGPTIG